MDQATHSVEYMKRLAESTYITGNFWLHRDRYNWTLREDRPSKRHGRALDDIGYYGGPDQLARGLAKIMAVDVETSAARLYDIQRAIETLAETIRSTIKEPA